MRIQQRRGLQPISLAREARNQLAAITSPPTPPATTSRFNLIPVHGIRALRRVVSRTPVTMASTEMRSEESNDLTCGSVS
jgi:hypothetical protein